MLEFPNSVLLSLSELGVCFLDNNNVWEILVGFLVFLKVTDVALLHVVGQDGVIEVKDFSQMRVDNKCTVINSKVFLPHNFYLNHSKSLSDGSSASIIIIVYVFNIYNDKFRKSISSKHALELVLPISSLVNFLCHHCLDVHDVDTVTDFVHENHWANTSIFLRDCLWEDDEVISTDWGKFDNEAIFVEVGSILFVVTDQLLGVFFLAQNVVFNEIGEPLGVGSMIEVEVETLSIKFVLDIGDFCCGVVLQNELFQEQECSLVTNLLSDLHLTLPQMGSISSLACIALQVCNHEFNDECLLKKCSSNNFLLNGSLDLESSGMSFSPNEVCVYKFYSL